MSQHRHTRRNHKRKPAVQGRTPTVIVDAVPPPMSARGRREAARRAAEMAANAARFETLRERHPQPAARKVVSIAGCRHSLTMLLLLAMSAAHPDGDR